MRLIELRLKNLNSLKGEWHIDFADTAFTNEGIFAITGQTGAGKTTILDAICLALYSQTPRLGDITGSANEIMTQGTGECSAEVIIEIDAKRYQCSWYQHRAHKKAKGNLLPIKHEISDVKTGHILEEKKSKTAAYIQNLIGMDFNQFTRSIMLAQGSFAAFLKSDIGDRAAILEKITGTDIYAKISLNVHEKKRAEEALLDQLQAGVNSLSLLTPEDETTLVVELTELSQQQSQQRQTFKTLSEQLQWLEAVQQLQQNLALYQTEFATAQQAQQTFMPEAKRLEAAKSALEIDSQFRELSHSRDMVKRLNTEQQDLLNKISAQQEAIARGASDLQDADLLEKRAADDLQTTLPLIAKTRELDTDIKQHSHAVADMNERKDVVVDRTRKLSQDIDLHKQVQQENEAHFAHIEKYFSNHQELNDLDTDMITFDNSCRRLKTILEDNTGLLADQIKHDSQARHRKDTAERLSEQQAAEASAIKQRREQLARLQQEQSILTQKQSIASMRGEQEQVDHIITQITQASFKQQHLSELAVQIKKTHLSMPLLSQELTTLEDLIASQQADIQETKLKRQEKQTHLNLLKKVAKLEDYIAELEDGVPCPLCGAHEHPYGNHHPLLDNYNDSNDQSNDQRQLPQTIQTEQQIAELETVIDDLEQTLSQYRIEHATKKETLSNQQQQLLSLKQQSKTLCSDMQASLSPLFDNKHAHSELMSAIITPLAQIKEDTGTLSQYLNSDLSIDQGDHQTVDQFDETLSVIASLFDEAKPRLLEKKDALKRLLAQYDEVTDAISALNSLIEQDEKQQHTLVKDLSELTTDIRLIQQKIDSMDEKIHTNFSELAPLMVTVSALVDKYPGGKYQAYVQTTLKTVDIEYSLKQLSHSIDDKSVLANTDYDVHIEHLRQQRTALNQLKQSFRDQKEHQQRITHTLSSLSAQIETKQAQLTHEEAALKDLTDQITNKRNDLEQLEQQRQLLFGDKTPDTEENTLRKAVDAAKAKQAAAQRQQDNAQQVLAQLITRQEQHAAERQAAMTMLETHQKAFTQKLTESQFADENAFIAAQLSKEARDTLYQRKIDLDNTLRQAKLQLDSTQQSLTQKLAKPMTEQSWETLASQHQQIQADIDQLSQHVGAIDQKLKDNERQKGEQVAQLATINAQKDKLQVWQQLHMLIGSADGKKYRTFAQGLTFQVMIKHANTKLQKMSDRYLLIHDEDSPLELNVIDNYQGGDIRSTKNLSGGEGFIISLALALGLSQMASHNIRVDSLFLDEGFGTLDEDSLDIALDTLTSLQQEGKLIGVISHVQALKDRILTQIKVEKLSGGFSQITGQGCQRIAH
ncbi:AAA family ATPase [Psychrobacter alimentarius]|uniref:AAA family ATPase n=1 Tax=Psychrobacter alimentarius TaxID=261164 RepID=UPI003FD140F5